MNGAAPATTTLPFPKPLAATLADYPAFINRTEAQRGDLSFHAAPLDHSLFDAPTLAVEIRCGDVVAATYRLNVDYHAAPGCLVFSPLLVKWAENGAHRKPGHDGVIIAHCVDCLLGLQHDRRIAGCDMLLTTGYLTVQRGGMAFFAGLGWKSANFSSARTRSTGETGLLRKVARRIDDISRADRTLPEETSTIRFAYRHFPARAAAVSQHI